MKEQQARCLIRAGQDAMRRYEQSKILSAFAALYRDREYVDTDYDECAVELPVMSSRSLARVMPKIVEAIQTEYVILKTEADAIQWPTEEIESGK